VPVSCPPHSSPKSAPPLSAQADPPPSTLADGWAKGYFITEDLASEGGSSLRSLNGDAVWRISGAKPGNGVDCLLDGSLDTFWQSDGVAPHTVYIQFYRRSTVAEVCLYLDFKVDESYTPRRVHLRAGTTHNDLEDVRTLELDQPSGWVRVPVGDPNGKGLQRYLRTWYLQIVVSAMHQNGRDTHIRAIRVLGPPAPGMPEAGSGAGSAAAAAGAAAAGAAAAPPPSEGGVAGLARFAPPSFLTVAGGEVR
jgi:anaphase-promoting complex subunit 10